eukprot:3434156-Alexandrium_andersonii.AAC.1
MACAARRCVSRRVGPQVVELVATPPRAPVARTRPWVRFDTLLREVPQPASPRVLLECRAL